MRKVIALAGHLAQFAVADDGTQWFWNGLSWEELQRKPLPQPEPLPELPRVEFPPMRAGLPIAEAPAFTPEPEARRTKKRTTTVYKVEP